MLVVSGRRMREWGGGIPRVRPPAVLTDLRKLVRLPHMTPHVTLLQGGVAVAAVAKGQSWRCVARVPLGSRWSRPWSRAEARRGQLSLCLYGCDRRAGYTCLTCTLRRRQAAGARASSASTMAQAMLDMHASAVSQFEGGTCRLGRATKLAPLPQLQLGGPSRGLGRAPPRPT